MDDATPTVEEVELEDEDEMDAAFAPPWKHEGSSPVKSSCCCPKADNKLP